MAMLPTTLLTLAVLSQARAPAPSAAPRPNPYLAQAKVFNQGLEYEKCLQRLVQASRWPSSAKEQVDIELYGGLCSFGAGRAEDAKERFALALQLDPKAALPPFTSPKITELFNDVRQRLGLTGTAAAVTAKTPPPAEPPVPTTPTDRPLAAAPAPSLTPRAEPVSPAAKKPWLHVAGKDAALPASLGVASLAATGAAVYLGVMAGSLEAQANAAPFQADALRIGGQAQTAALWANVGYAVAGTALVSAVTVFLLAPTVP